MNVSAQEIGIQIQEFFNDQVEAVARKTKFVQRRSKLTGTKLLQAMVFNSLEKREMTLSSLAQSCLDLGVEISEQGLDERLNESSVAFLREMSTRALGLFRLEETIDIKMLNQFSGVYLVDSSQISLPESMAGLFQGSGGNASTASMKTQLVFDYLHGHFELFELCQGREADQGYRGHWSIIRAGTLFIMDLGYFVLDTFKNISEHDGYFLSRFQAQTALYDSTAQRIELAQWLATRNEPLVECDVLIGSRRRHRIPCRLIAVRLCQEAADRRRQKAKGNARRHGRTVSKEWLKLLDWALFITNVPAAMLQTEHVSSLYRIRWQIELVFKMCKSFCGLNYVASLRPTRILTEFYARLIGLVLTYYLIAPLRLPFGPAQNREISPVKVRLVFQRFARTLALALHTPNAFISHMHEFFRHVVRFGFKQKRRKSPNAIHALALISACYDWDPNDFSTHSLHDFLSLQP